MKFLSQAISFIFHPLLLTTLLFIVLILLSPEMLIPYNALNFMNLLIFIFTSTYIIPATVVYGLYLTKIISSLQLETKKERIIIIVITAVAYSLVLYLLYYNLRANEEMITLFIVVLTNMVLAGVITLFWKISLHSVATSGILFYLGYCTYLYDFQSLFHPILISVLVSGLIMSSRLYLDKHTPCQVWAGIALGFVSNSTVFIIKYIL